MSAKVKVGDLVALNDTGLEVIFGNSRGLTRMKGLQMRITHVDPVSLTSPEETYPVEVDNEEINFFLIFDDCFDKVQP
jgi:hypothetical protein